MGVARDSVYKDADLSRHPLELTTFSNKISGSAMTAICLIGVLVATLVAAGATMDVQSDGRQMFMVSVDRER